MASHEVRIRLFGAFRDLCEDSELAVSIPAREASVEEIRGALLDCLSARVKPAAGGAAAPSPRGPRRWLPAGELRELVARSALADERQVLKGDDRVGAGARLAILPPVCGG